MERLQKLLEDIPQAEREDALQYYNDYLDDAGPENENEALAALGSPERIADSIRIGLQDGEAFGEFTEEGFRMDEGEKREPVPVSGWAEKTESEGNRAGSGEKGGFENGFYAGAQENGTAGPGTGRYGGPGANGYGGPGPGTNGYGTYGSGPSGFGPGGPGGPGPKGPWNGPDMSASMSQKPQKRSAGKIVLLILACIFLLPILVPLGLGAVIIAFAFLVCVVVFFACIVIAGIAVLAVGGALVAFAVANLAAFPTSAVCILGGGLICLGIGIILTLLMCWLAAKTVPALCRGFVKLCSLPFHRKG